METSGGGPRRSDGERGDRGDRRGGPGGRRDRRPPRRKVCRFCAAKIKRIDINDTTIMRGFVSERGRILSRRVSGNCAKHQRQITRGIRRGRHAALLPYAVV